MVNPVGSCGNKHWQKKWAHLKRDVTVEPLQHSLIVGSLLGDATMRLGDGAINANFKVEHGLKQKEYVFWKYDILRNLVYTEPKISVRYDEQRAAYEKSWWFRTIRHPVLTDIYNRFYTREGYRVGRKIVPKDVGKNLNAFAFAAWVMDDSCYSNGSIDISTYAFLLPEIHLLQRVIKENFGIIIAYHKDRDKGYRMYCNKTETKKVIETIYPYIVPCMMYKIGFYNPVTTGSEASVIRR